MGERPVHNSDDDYSTYHVFLTEDSRSEADSEKIRRRIVVHVPRKQFQDNKMREASNDAKALYGVEIWDGAKVRQKKREFPKWIVFGYDAVLDAARIGSRRLPELEVESAFSLPTVTLASATMLLGGYLLFRCLRRFRSPQRPKRDSR